MVWLFGRFWSRHFNSTGEGEEREKHIPSLWVVNGTCPSISSANFGTWEPSARPTDGRTDDRYQDVCIETYGWAASKRAIAGAWFEVRLMTAVSTEVVA